MAISKIQPMRPAEIELVDTVNGLDSSVTQAVQKANQATADVEFLDITVRDLNSQVTNLGDDLAQCVNTTNSLSTDMQTAQTDISNLDDAARTAAANIYGLQTDMTSAENNIASLQSAINALSNVETINYLENIQVASSSGVTISAATLKKLGKVCLLNVNYSIASANAIAAGNWRNIFDIKGPYAPIEGFAYPAAVNDKTAAAMVNNTNAMWIKAYNAAHSGSHYVGVIYLTN